MKTINNCDLDELETLSDPIYKIINNKDMKEAINSNNPLKVGATALKKCESECNVIFNVLGNPETVKDKCSLIYTTIASVYADKYMLDFFTSVKTMTDKK